MSLLEMLQYASDKLNEVYPTLTGDEQQIVLPLIADVEVAIQKLTALYGS